LTHPAASKLRRGTSAGEGFDSPRQEEDPAEITRYLREQERFKGSFSFSGCPEKERSMALIGDLEIRKTGIPRLSLFF
jgi:hypothetical protein